MADWTWFILSHFLPFAKEFGPLVNTFSAHCFPPVHLHLHFTHLRCSFPQFVAELDVCTLLHCTVTLRSTGCSWFTLPVTCSPCCVSIIPMSLKNTCTKLPFRYDTIHRTFRHTFYIPQNFIFYLISSKLCVKLHVILISQFLSVIYTTRFTILFYDHRLTK